MKKIKNMIKEKEIFFRLFLLSSACTAIVCLITISAIITRSQTTYTESYKKSNDIIVSRIQNDYDQLIQNINQSFDYIEHNNYIESFLTAPKNDVNSILSLKNELKNSTYISSEISSNLILIGHNKRSFYQNQTKSVYSVDELLNSSLIESIDSSLASNQIYFQTNGMTTANHSSPGILFVRKLERDTDIYGYAFFFVSERFFSNIYRNSLDPNFHSTLIVDNSNTIVSSTSKEDIGKKINEKKIKQSTEQIKLAAYDYTLYNTIDQKVLIRNMNLRKTGLLIFIFSIFLTSILSFFLSKRITSPIYSLMNSLQNTTKYNLTNNIELKGTYETKQLGKTYNDMLESLDVYIDDLLKAEKENHLMEIKTLQMQIQPHFIYNTLTAIKFLSWQEEHKKVIAAIDSFIHLLQQTFNNQEIITLEAELSIATDYINLLKIRYGSQIDTIIFADKDCHDILIPKMIIQPIIENSYLHAFPENRKGTVQIFATKKSNKLHIDIIDNGIGFDVSIKSTSDDPSSRNYSSIGLSNIHDRIKLMYGVEYGAFIQSEIGKGTVVSLILPVTYSDFED